jgi:hypothetical protein
VLIFLDIHTAVVEELLDVDEEGVVEEEAEER